MNNCQNCQDYIEKMNLYLDGELSVNEVSDLLRHIENCDACHKRFDNLKTVVYGTRRMRISPPEGLHSGIMRAVAQEKPARRAAARQRLARYSALAACVALLLVVVSTVAPQLGNIYLFGRHTGGSADMQMAGEAEKDASAAPRGVQPATLPQDEAAEGGAASDAVLYGDEGGGRDSSTETVQETAPEQYSIDPKNGARLSAPPDAFDYDLFTVPQLSVTERVGFYIIATGKADGLTDIFPLESVVSYHEVGEIYVFIDNTEEAKGEAEYLLAQAGYTLYANVENLPETSGEAEHGLVVIFENRQGA